MLWKCVSGLHDRYNGAKWENTRKKALVRINTCFPPAARSGRPQRDAAARRPLATRWRGHQVRRLWHKSITGFYQQQHDNKYNIIRHQLEPLIYYSNSTIIYYSEDNFISIVLFYSILVYNARKSLRGDSHLKDEKPTWLHNTETNK